MSIRILLADDHTMIRQGLRSLLNAQPDFDVVAEASDGRAAVEAASELQPDVVVMDVRMPDLNGIDATRQVLATRPGAKVIALSASTDERTTGEMLRAGASGYVHKDAAFDELATAVRTVMQGKVYLSPSIARNVVIDFVRSTNVAGRPPSSPRNGSVFDVLSTREREVLQLMAEGRATKEIAVDLNVSVKTVETHRRNLMEKLNLDSVAELTKYAVREGLTSL
jgi:DNA-binding NarL/FixJ family response regulator